jgi:hypothetical protein
MIRPSLLFLLGILLGLAPTIWIIQKNPIVKKLSIKTILLALENELESHVTVESATFNFLRGTIELHNAVIKPHSSSKVYVTFETGQIHLSRRSYLVQNTLEMFTSLHNVHVHASTIQHISNAIPLLTNPMKPKKRKLPVKLKALSINNILLETDDNVTINLSSTICFEKEVNGLWSGSISPQNAFGKHKTTTIFEQMNGNFFLKQYDFNQGFSAEGNLSFDVPSLSKRKCTLQTTITEQKHQTLLENETKKLSISIHGETFDEAIFSGHLPLEIFSPYIKKETLSGLCNISGRTSLHPSFTGHATISISHPSILKEGKASLQLKNQTISGKYSCTTNNNITFLGTSSFDLTTKTGTMEIENSSQIAHKQLPLSIAPQNFRLAAKINPSFSLQGSYHIALTNLQNSIEMKTAGNFFLKKESLFFSGTTPYGSFTGILDILKKPFLSRFVLKKGLKTLVSVRSSRGKFLNGTIDYGLINTILKQHYKYALLGNRGLFRFSFEFDEKLTKGSVSFKKGTIYFPSIKNLMTALEINFSYDPNSRTLNLYDFFAQFKQGSIYSKLSTAQFDEKYAPILFHSSLSLSNLFLGWKKDFFGIVYGNVLFQKTAPQKAPTLDGNVILKKTILKENIFSNLSSTENGGLERTPLENDSQEIICKFSISNEQPITTKTAFLNTEADINLKVEVPYRNGIFLSPKIQGNIHIKKGSFDFLQNKLLISSGKIHFLPNQTNNPVLNVTATNKIKKYCITLHITGPTDNPTILLESNPELSEEQILGLLLAGSEHSVLQADFPTMVIQNLNNLITGKKKDLTNTMHFFKRITQPLKYVQLVPNFTDQSGRGGIKGSLSLDLNKRLHAHIQKNLSTQEDLSFQIEYFIADDLNIKAIRDQRGDVGAEIELRIKP